jgi:hypothetical protein
MSMLVVIVGHWLAAAPYFDATNTLTASHILTVVPWTAWLTWIVQVMPIFFMVGGYANGISWRAARRDGKSYAAWLESRLRRLVWPILPLLVVWVAIVAIEHARGVRPELTWLAGGVHTNMVPRGVHRHCPARPDDGGRMGSIWNAFLLGPDSCRNRR